MTTRIRLNSGSDNRGTVGGMSGATSDSRSDGFSLRFAGGRGVLVHGPQVLSPALTVDSFEMAIPAIAFPFDISSGISGLRNRRHKLTTIGITVSYDGLCGFVSDRAAISQWISGVRLSFEEDALCLLADYGPAGAAIPFSLRLLPEISGRSISFRIDEPRAYGPLPAPLLQAAGALVRELLDTRLETPVLQMPDPVQHCLMQILPGKGWRLPDTDDIFISGLEILPGSIRLRYHSRENAPDEIVAAGRVRGMDRLRRFEELKLSSDVDEALVSGDFQTARNLCARHLERTPDNAAILTRQTMIDVLNPVIAVTSLSVLEGAVPGFETRSDTLAVMAHGAALTEDAGLEARALDGLLKKSLPLELQAAALRAGRLMRLIDPQRSVAYLEQAMATRREDPTVLLALMETRAAMKDADALSRLIPRWIAAHPDAESRVQAHILAGQILLRDLEDGEKALRHFERASIADPDNIEAAWGLADCLAVTREVERSVSAYERLGALAIAAEDHRNAARAAASIGNVWLVSGEPDLAIPRFRESLNHFWDAEIQLKLARALVAIGRVEEGIPRFEEALSRDRRMDEVWGNNALTLARLYLSRFEDYAAADVWVKEAARCPGCETVAESLRVQLLEKQQRWSELTATLEKQLLSTPSVETALQLARARIRAGDFAPAMATLEMALELNPHREDLLDAYIEAARASGATVGLKKALIKRWDTARTPEQRGTWAAEIGALELSVFEDLGSAMKWLELALRDTPESLSARESMVRVMTRIGTPEDLDRHRAALAAACFSAGMREKAAIVLYERSGYLIEIGKADEAAALLRQAMPDLGESVKHSAMMRMGSLFLENRQFVLARDMFTTARREGASEDRYLAALGEAEAARQLGDYAAAWDAAVMAGSGPPELRVKAVRLLAQISSPVKKTAEAVQIISRVAQNVTNEEAVSLLELAAELAEDQLGDFQTALALYEDALEIDPLNDRVRNRVVSALEKTGNRADLAQALLRFAGTDSAGIADLQRAADFFSAEGLYADAAEALSRSHRIRPDAESARMLAQALRRAGQEEAMVGLLRNFASEDPQIRDMLADHLLESGRRDELIAFLSQTREQDPQREYQRLLSLAELMIEAGRRGPAIAQILRAVDIAPPGPKKDTELQRAMTLAMEERHPEMLTEGIRRLSKSAAEDFVTFWQANLATLYHSLGRSAESLAALDAIAPSENLATDAVLELARRNPSFEPLLERLRESASRSAEWPIVEELWGVSLNNARPEKRAAYLVQRALLRKLRMSDIPGAISDLMAANELNGLTSAQRSELSGLLEQSGRLEEAFSVCAQRIETDPVDDNDALRAADLAKRLGRADEELAWLRKAAEKEPAPDTVLRLLSSLRMDRDRDEMERLIALVDQTDSRSTPDQSRRLWNIRAELKLAALDPAGAAQAWMTLLGRFGHDQATWERVVSALTSARRPDILARAIDTHLQIEMDEESRLSDNLLLVRICRDDLGDMERAASACAAVLAISPEHTEANMTLAARAYAANDMAQLAARVEVLKKGSWHPEVAMWQGAVAESTGNLDEARECYRTLMDRSPQTPGAAEGYLRTISDTESDSAVLQAVESASRSRGSLKLPSTSQRRIGAAYFRKGDLARALGFLQSATDDAENDIASLKMLARIYEHDEAFEQQARTLSKIGRLQGGDGRTDAYVGAARIYLDRMKDYKRAYYWFSCASETGPDEPDVLLGLADCAWENKAWSVVSRSFERLRVVAPHLTIDPPRMFRFAAALAETREWPDADILEMLERVQPSLKGKDSTVAQELHERLVTRKNKR